MSVKNQGIALRMTDAALVYGNTGLIQDVNLSAAPGELLALLGSSDSGETSLFRAIAGLLPLTTGEIRFNDVWVNEPPVEERQLDIIFQKHHLFPMLMVYRNLEICLTGTVTARVTATEAVARIAELLPALGLTSLETHFPAEPSGEQQRRVVLARILLVRPRLLLLDEPFTDFDVPLRRELMELLRREQRSRRLTTVSVTYGEENATRIADSTARLCDTAGTRSLRQVPLQRL